MGKIISVANQKGGVGKTTTTVNLSTLLAKKGKKVLLIDTDPQGNATSGLGVTKELELSVYDVLVGDTTFIDTVEKTSIKNLSICPSNISLAGAEVQLVSMMSREQRLKVKLDEIKDLYDFILIDCPPSLGLITLNAFTASDSVLIPVQCEYFALEGLGQLLNTVNLVKKHLNKGLEIVIPEKSQETKSDDINNKELEVKDLTLDGTQETKTTEEKTKTKKKLSDKLKVTKQDKTDKQNKENKTDKKGE